MNSNPIAQSLRNDCCRAEAVQVYREGDLGADVIVEV